MTNPYLTQPPAAGELSERTGLLIAATVMQAMLFPSLDMLVCFGTLVHFSYAVAIAAGISYIVFRTWPAPQVTAPLHRTILLTAYLLFTVGAVMTVIIPCPWASVPIAAAWGALYLPGRFLPYRPAI